MELGNFSVSLAVQDLERSKAFYETLGFQVLGGDAGQGWLILRNGACVLGLFQGMFDKNILTFNPGWDDKAQPLDDFEDVRIIQARLQQAGVALVEGTEPDGDGPAHVVLEDPDGNRIMLDQHVPAPKPAG